jgi:hypothetical protein
MEARLIERIRTERSSAGKAHLRGGSLLPITKVYRERLLDRRPAFVN